MILNAHSWYSLRYGTLSPQQLAQGLLQQGYDACVLTDINNTTGTLEFIKECNQLGIKGIGGAELRVNNALLYVLIARNNKGFSEINELITQSNLNGQAIPERAPLFNDVFVMYPYGSISSDSLRDNEYIGIRPAQLRKLLSSSQRQNRKYVMWQPLTFQNSQGYDLHKELRAIDNNILLSQLQPHQYAVADEVLPARDRLLEVYREFPQMIRNARYIIESCRFDFDFHVVKNKATYTGSAYDDKLLLEKLALDGMKQRYGSRNKEAHSRVKKELAIIDKLGFSSYFLITWDIIRYSMSRGFYHVGRGSGANSVVAYCLKITDVCPIELDLYFERFLNPKRKSPPDFDIDYSWKERDEVLDYIFKRYGAAHTALLGAMSTFKDRSILREMGKVYGLPKAEIDRLVENPESVMNKNQITDHILSVYDRLADFPNIRSIHAGGVLISEEPITMYTALDMPPKGFATTQFDMYLAEDIGFEKLDILSQRGIGHIKECAELVLKNRGIKIDVHEVEKFKRDDKVAAQLRSGDTIGCFYIESPAMRGLLKKLQCDDYLTLVAASSIIRPGVARSGMMREYIYRFHHPDKFEYLHPVMEQQLKETYGVMVYQEDVLKVCHHFGGLDLADADVLRRMMSGKSRNKKHLEEIAQKYFDNCKASGYSDKLSHEVWRQIESFAGYSFSKAHSASYAVESYQSLYLKSHFPLEFMTAVINNFGGFYRSSVYINEARKSGARIHLPCVNRSQYTTCIYGSDIFLGFIHLQNMEAGFAAQLINERKRGGEFTDLANLIERTGIGLEQLIILIRIGALRFTSLSKKELLWKAHSLMNQVKVQPAAGQLFKTPTREYRLPVLESDNLEDVYDEIELLGFPVTLSAFDLLQTSFRGEIKARELNNCVGKTVRMVGNFVAVKYVQTIRKEIMNFGTFLDDEGNFFDTVHFPPSLKLYPFKGAGVYLIMGRVVEEFGFASLEVDKLAKLPIKPDPRSA